MPKNGGGGGAGKGGECVMPKILGGWGGGGESLGYRRAARQYRGRSGKRQRRAGFNSACFQSVLDFSALNHWNKKRIRTESAEKVDQDPVLYWLSRSKIPIKKRSRYYFPF
jgi:hypothetical protein